MRSNKNPMADRIMRQLEKIEDISKIKDEGLRKRKLMKWSAKCRNMIEFSSLKQEAKNRFYSLISEVIDRINEEGAIK